MFKVGDIIKIKEDKILPSYIRYMEEFNQSYIIIDVNSSIISFKGLKDNIIYTKISLFFELDLLYQRKLKLEKICSKLVTK